MTVIFWTSSRWRSSNSGTSGKKERVFQGAVRLKFSYKEQREYETIEDDIAALEQQITDTEAEITASSSDYVALQKLTERREQLSQTLSDKMDRWVYLSDLADRIENGETVQKG